MWLRFITFCVLVSFVLFVVLSCIHGRPVIHLLFRRCCEDDIENDQVIYENFGNNFLRERLIGTEMQIDDTEGLVSATDAEELLSTLREKVNVHDPKTRNLIETPNRDNETKTEVEEILVEKMNELIQTLSEMDNNITFNDILIDSHEASKKDLTSNNEILSELDSEEVSSVEVTTENAKIKSSLPIKLIQLVKKDAENSKATEKIIVDGEDIIKPILNNEQRKSTKTIESSNFDERKTDGTLNWNVTKYDESKYKPLKRLTGDVLR